MENAGILPDFAGIVVSDRYQNYFSTRWEHIAGNQACLAHLLRDSLGDDGLGVLKIDVPSDREAEQTALLLAMDHRDDVGGIALHSRPRAALELHQPHIGL